MNVYPSAVNAFLAGDIDVMTATIMAQLVDGFAYVSSHNALDDVPAPNRVHTPEPVVIDSVSAAAVWINGDLVFNSVASGDTVTAVVFYVDTGTESTSTLLAHIDRRVDTIPLSYETNGGDITLSFTYLLKL